MYATSNAEAPCCPAVHLSPQPVMHADTCTRVHRVCTMQERSQATQFEHRFPPVERGIACAFDQGKLNDGGWQLSYLASSHNFVSHHALECSVINPPNQTNTHSRTELCPQPAWRLPVETPGYGSSTPGNLCITHPPTGLGNR